MAEEDKRKILLAILSDINLPDKKISELTETELASIEEMHKEFNIQYNKTYPLPTGITPLLEYSEKRRIYVNKRIAEEISKTKKTLETQL